MKLFPYVLTRYSGGSFTDFENLRIGVTHQLVQQINNQKQQLKSLKNNISDAIHPLIPSFNEKPDTQKLLINLRRDIFNERGIKEDKLILAKEVLSAEIVNDIQQYVCIYLQIETLVKQGAQLYEKELREARLRLKDIIKNEDFQKGLILSSRSILDQLNRYLEKNPSDYRKKEIHIEQGMMKYISRMYGKTSPFSTFTSLAIGEITPLTNPEAVIDHKNAETNFKLKSHIRINNYLYQFLRGLLLKNKDIFSWFPVRLNPTIQRNNETYLFLTNSNNVEAFQRIPVSPVLDFFLELVSEKSEGIIYNDLLLTLTENIEASQEELQAYINQLIEYGFLEFNIGVSGTDPDWDTMLQSKLQLAIENNAPDIKELAEILTSVRNLAHQYEAGTVNDRQKLQQQAYDELRAVCMKIHEAAGLPADERKTREELMAEAKKKQEEEKQLEKEKAAKETAEAAQKKEAGTAENKTAEAAQREEKTPQPETEKVNTEEPTTETNHDDEQVIFKHQASTYFYFRPEQMFYEDATVEVSPLFNTTDFEVVMNKFYKLLTTFKSFEFSFDEREKMACFFVAKYGKDTRVDLLSFYEDFYRDYKKKELEAANKIKKEQQEKSEEAIKKAEEEKLAKKQAEKTTASPQTEKKTAEAAQREEIKKDTEEKPEEKKEDKQEGKTEGKTEDKKVESTPFVPIESERIKLRQEINTKWLEAFTAICKEKIKWNEDEINIHSDIFDEANEKVPLKLYDDVKSSYAAFMMPYIETDASGKKRLMSMTNASFAGYGKLFSRFLHILDPKVTDALRKWNQEINKEFINAEDTDASFFNANLHPPLLPYEMWIPSGNNSLPPEQQIPITDIEVAFNAESGFLMLIHKKHQKEVKIFDLCFQGINGRSQLFQLLEKFTLSRQPNFMYLMASINGLKPKEEDDNSKPRISKWPRLVFENQLVLKRQSWYVPKPLLPQRDPNDNNWRYFERVNLWRLEHGIPHEVFIYITNRNELEVLAPSQKKNINRDDYKPQYISFENPFLVLMLEKLIEKTPVSLRIEEMLPGSSQLLEVNGQKHIMELVVQLYE